MTEQATTMYEPQPADVLCGRGGQTNNHEGNRAFRSIVARHQTEYLASRKMDKAKIARRIVSIIHDNGGKFISKNADGQWVEVDDKKAKEKTSQALREGLDVRRKTTGKSPRRNSDSSDAATLTDEEPASKRPRVGKTVSWDESIPSLKQYDAGETTMLPELQDEVIKMFQARPSVSREECDYVASV